MGIFGSITSGINNIVINGMIEKIYKKAGTQGLQKLIVKALDRITANEDNTFSKEALAEIKVFISKNLKYKG